MRHRYLLPIALATFALSSPVFPQDKKVDELLEKMLQEMYPGEEDIRYFSAYADLNGDGRAEAVVYTIGPRICGSGGCETHVLSRGKDGYEHVSSIGLTRPPIVASKSRTEGWRDLIVFVQGGGIVEGYNVRLTFEVGIYPESAANVVPLHGPVDGDVLIARATFDEGRPVPKPSRPIEPCRPSKELAWRRVQTGRPQDPQEVARAVDAFRNECGLPLNFWAGPEADEEQSVAHPCSGVMLDFVKSIPPPSHPVFRPEMVYELDASGEVVGQWWVPVDSVVDGIAGEELLISFDVDGTDPASSFYLSVGRQGTFSIGAFRPLPEGNLIECPKSKSLPVSDSRWCWELIDRRSGQARRIAYDGPCT